MRRRYQVFISSTYADLHKEREGVAWEILKARHIPAGMENFPATDDRGWRIIQRTIDDSDYYVLIVGGRYGSIDAETGLSWTEREYDYARERGLPVLSFIREARAITADKEDHDDRRPKLLAFKGRLCANHFCKSWQTADDLKAEVAAALGRAIEDDEDANNARPGWLRGNTIPENALEEIARLSKENNEMRSQMADLTAKRKSLLQLVDRSGAPLEGKITNTRPRYSVREAQGGNEMNMIREFNRRPAKDLQNEINRTYWVRAALRNTGTAVARNIQARFEVARVGEILRRHHNTSGVFSLASQSANAHAVIAEETVGANGTGTVVQRIRSIGVNQQEKLIGMGFVATAESNGGTQLQFVMTYSFTDEEGSQTTGEVTIESVFSEQRLIGVADIENI